MNAFSLESKTVVVTGASSGIGRQTAIECSNAGARVIILGRDEVRLGETLCQLKKNTRQHITLAIDLTDEQQLIALLNEKLANVKVDGIVNCAGVSTTLPFRVVTTEKIKEFFNVNVFASLALTRQLTRPQFIRESGCSVIFLASIMAITGEAGKTIYSATKGALVSAARSLAVELAPRKIRVNCISPGVVVTPMTDHAAYSETVESREKIKALHPLGFGMPSDVALASVYLLSDAARWVTGINLTIDGGYTAK